MKLKKKNRSTKEPKGLIRETRRAPHESPSCPDAYTGHFYCEEVIPHINKQSIWIY